MFVNSVVKVMSLLIVTESALGFSFGVRALAELIATAIAAHNIQAEDQFWD